MVKCITSYCCYFCGRYNKSNSRDRVECKQCGEWYHISKAKMRIEVN